MLQEQVRYQEHAEDQERYRAQVPSIFATVQNWAIATIRVVNPFTLKQRVCERLRALPNVLYERFEHPLRLAAVPVVREDGAIKRRLLELGGISSSPIARLPRLGASATRPHHRALINAHRRSPNINPSDKKQLLDLGYEPLPDTPSPASTALLIAVHGLQRQYGRPTRPASEIWSGSPVSERLAPIPQPNFQATTPTQFAEEDPQHATDDVDMDIWLPSPISQKSAPVLRFHAPTPIPQHATEDVDMDVILDFSYSDMLTSTPPRQALRQSPSPIAWDSPSIYAESPPTSMRQNLLKMQLRRGAELSDIEEEYESEDELAAGHTQPLRFNLLSSSPFQSDVESPKSVAENQSSPFQTDVESSPFQSNVSSSPFQVDVEYPFIPGPKTVRWAEHARTKTFYCDQRVSEMLDASLEMTTYCTTKWNEADFADEDSLDESQISIELLDDLQDDLARNLGLAEPAAAAAPKPLVMPLDSQEMGALDGVAAASENGQIADFPIVDDKLKAKDFATLLPGLFNGDPRAWLNDEIVNDYLTILVNHKKTEAGFVKQKGGPAPPMHAFSSFWYTQIKTNKESVKRWAFRAQLEGPQYLDAKLILYPICDRGHWRLLAVKPQERTIEYLDSLGFSGQSYTTILMEYLQMELGDAFIAEEWTIIDGQRSTRQVNGSDCGVFTLLNALALLRGEEASRVIACDGMLDARERIATTLMQQKPTTEME